MDELWRGVIDFFRVAAAALFGFWSGGLKAENDQINADLRQQTKELKTYEKNRMAVDGLSERELDDELRDPPRL